MKNIMVDLETLGTVPGCAILSIGAVDFSEDGVGSKEFYQPIWTESCNEVFMSQSASTISWWKRQSPEARKVFDDCQDKKRSVPIKAALASFGVYVQSFGKDVQVWGNGSDFDNAILAVAYDLCDMPLPWRFTNNRCYRTLKSLHPDLQLHRTGTYHNALDDAKTQAEHGVRLLLRQRDCAAVWGETQDEPEPEPMSKFFEEIENVR